MLAGIVSSVPIPERWLTHIKDMSRRRAGHDYIDTEARYRQGAQMFLAVFAIAGLPLPRARNAYPADKSVLHANSIRDSPDNSNSTKLIATVTQRK